MPPDSPSLQQVLEFPGRFLWRVIKGFHANQGLLLAGAVAYYTLLSVIPLFTLLLVALSHLVEEAQLMATLRQYLELVVPGESEEIVVEIAAFLENRDVVGWLLVGVLLFFSSMAFSVLENAMSVIFFRRVKSRRRHFLVSAVLPYLFILFLGFGFLIVTLIASSLQTLGEAEFYLAGRTWSLGVLSVVLLYLIGLTGQILMLTAIYIVMPVGRITLRSALAGGITAGLLWEITRHGLVWYFSSLSFVSVVYGSLATAIIVLLTLEVAAIILLLGAQVIAEFEPLDHVSDKEPHERIRKEEQEGES